MMEQKIKLTEKQILAIQTLVSLYFKDSKGEPYKMSVGQCYIFYSIVKKDLKWVWVSAPTRYGKTETIAIAALYLAVFKHLKIPIVGGSKDKAEKIMEYIIGHIDDSPIFYNGLLNLEAIENIDKMKAQKLKIQMSKEALRWYTGGWIYITSIESRNASREGEKVVGEGGDVVILEEAGLIRHKEQYSKVVRMAEGDWGKLVMSGNCIEKSVFADAYLDPMFIKVRISLRQSIEEGRYTREVLAQKKTQTTSKDWKRYYLVRFPKANEFTYFKPMKYDLLPNDLQFYGALDPALGEAKKGSLVGIVVVGVSTSTGQAYEVWHSGIQMKPEEAIRVIFNLPYKFQRFVIEAVMFQKYFLKVLQEKSKTERKYIPFDGINQSKKKEERIESLEPAINTGQILFKGEGELWEELSDYPDTESKDVLDALEMVWRTIGLGGFDSEVV